MNKIRFFILVGIILFAVVLVSTTFVVTAQAPDDQPVDETLGNPPSEGPALRGAEVPAGGTLSILDDFNRADGPIGPDWTVHDGYCNVSNNAAVCGGYGRATFNSAPGDGNFAEADVAVNGTALQYTGLLLNYGAGISNLFIKVQEQSPYDGRFTHGACYTGVGGGGFGLGFFPLTSLFSTAHMAVERVGNTVTIYFTNVDGGSQPDQTYVCDGAPAPEGTGIGINGYTGIARLDNFGIPSAAEPDITVDPAELHAFLPPDWQVTMPLTICNVGDATLVWALIEMEGSPLMGWKPEYISGPFEVGPASENVGDGEGVTSPVPVGNVPVYQPQYVLYDNGPLVTHPGGGYDGADASVLQTNLGMTTYGFGAQVIYNYSVADDFTVPAGGYDIDSMTFYAYQTGSPTDPPTINEVRVQIWDGIPTDPGSSVVFGDLTTNRLESVIWSGMYRVTDTDMMGNTRPVMATVATVDVTLPEGTYWVEYMLGGTLSSGPWVPPVTILGETGKPGANGLQNLAGAWEPLQDTGTFTAQDIPFLIIGAGGGPVDIPWLSEDPITGTLEADMCTVVDVTFDSTGLPPGDYFGELVVFSNDPDTPLIAVPVELSVLSILWDKYINGVPWEPDMEITVETSDTIVVEEVLHLMQPSWLAAAAGSPAQFQPEVEVHHVEASQPAETASGVQPPLASLPANSPRPLQNPGLLYLTSLDLGNTTFAVYDPGVDAWTTLNPYATGAQMAVSADGHLYAYGNATSTIDVYDPATDSWSAVMPAPPGATGQYGNLEITNMGEFFYTEVNATTLWYTSGGAWSTFALPFTTNVMGDYDPSTDQYVIGQYATTNAHMIDVHTFAITNFTSPLYNGEYARFSVVMGDRYYFEAAGSNIHYFDLSNPAAPPVDTGVNWGYYSSAAGDRAHNVIFNASLDAIGLALYDATANTISPLTGYGYMGNHSSVAFVESPIQEPAEFAQVEYWDPAHLQLLDWAATGGQVEVGPDSLIWTGEILEPTTITLTKWLHVEPSTWTETLLWEELWLDDTLLEERPVTILKLAPELWIDAVYDPQVYAGQDATFTLDYGNTGGYENDVMVRNEFPAEAPFVSSVPMPDRQDPGGLWAEWDVGDLAMDAQGSIEVTIMIQPDVPGLTIIEVWDGIFNHLDDLADEVFIYFEVVPTADLGVIKDAPAEVYVGEPFTYTVIVTNHGQDDASDIALMDYLPTSVTYVSNDLGCAYNSGVVTCEFATLAADASVTLHIVVTAVAPGTATNTASTWSNDYDPDEENNLASVDTLISEVIIEKYYYNVPIVFKH